MNTAKSISLKIAAGNDLDRTLAMWRFLSRKIVFTNGCFDILHKGHIDYLMKASAYGDVLVIGLNSDESVRKIKGPSRPVMDESSRALLLASLHFVDLVVLFDEETPYNLINQVQPDVLIKGGDYKTTDIVGNDIVRAKGGNVTTIDFLDGYSTSGIISKINSMNG